MSTGASAGASVKVATPSAPTGPKQKVGMERAQELMLEINDIATKKKGGNYADVEKMKPILVELRELFNMIRESMLDGNTGKAKLKTLNTKLTELSHITDFADFSKGWVKAVNFFAGLKQNQ